MVLTRQSAAAGTGEAVEVRDFRDGDTPAVLDLLRVAFGKWPRDIAAVDPEEFFRWKHAECPFGPSRMYVAQAADGAVVGFEARLPWLFAAGSKRLLASRGADLAVHPEHRGRGISLALRRAARFTDEAFTWSNPNPQSMPGSIRFGRTLVGTVPRFVRPAGRPGLTLARLAGRQSHAVGELPMQAPSAAEALGEWQPGPGVLDPGDRLATARSVDYLRWRYAHPEYRAVRTELSGHGEGIAIFRARRRGHLWWADVCELIVGDPGSRSAARLFGAVIDAAPVDLVRCCFPSRSTALRHGFLAYPRSGAALMTTPLRSGVEPDPTRLSSWALSGGDLEVL